MQPLMGKVGTPDGQFHDGNSATGELGTIVSALWLNALQSATRSVQSELLSVIEAAGLTADPDEINQLEVAIKQLAWGAQHRPTTLGGYGIRDALPNHAPLGSAVDLNSILGTGLYLQGSTADAASGSNYPVHLGGWLMVYSPGEAAGGAVVQQYHTVYGRRVFARSLESGSWSPWREFASTEHGKVVINASTTFVVPENVRRICVTLAGGGGGGAGAIDGASYVPGGGGAGEVKYREWVDVSPGQSINVTIGAGGAGGIGSAAGGTYSNSTGHTGGVSSFGALLTASGGGGGTCQPGYSNGGSSVGPYSASGQDGDVREIATLGGAGGGNILAPVTYGDYSNAGAASNYGGGGAGGRAGYWQDGSAGGVGVCIIEW